MENNNTEEPDIQIEDTTTDSVIFSVTYPNYQNNLLHDKENKTLGQWIIDSKNFSKVKYAYAYLKNSDKMIVKKYHIQNFEYSKSEKGYMDDWKVCFVFSKSEDVFFEYPYGSVVQGRHYGSSVKMDNSPKLSESEIERRLQKSKETPIVEYRVGKTGQPRKPREPRKRTPREIKLTTKDKLVKIYQEKFRDKKLRYLTDVNMLVAKVDEGQEPEQVLTNFEIFLERKYPRNRGYYVCSKCEKVRDKKIIKELADSISDLSFYDYPKKIANYKKQEKE